MAARGLVNGRDPPSSGGRDLPFLTIPSWLGKGIFVNLHEERFIKGFLINFQQFLTLQKLSAGPEGLVPFGRDVGTGMVYDK